MKSSLEKLPDGTAAITMTVPWTDVAKLYEQVVSQLVASSELPGFRKGKAPRALVEKKLPKAEVYEEVLKLLLPKIYNEAVAEHKLRPLIIPKIELKEAKEASPWVIRALTCKKPHIPLGNYRAAVADINPARATKSWAPGENRKTTDARRAKPSLDEL